MERVKVGVLGAGSMGEVHVKNLIQIPGAEIKAICDVSRSRAEALSRLCEAKVYTDFNEMLEKEELEVLYILLPPFAQNGQFEQAAEKGIHIFIEKPIAIASDRGKSMVDAARKAKIKSHVGFHMRYGTAIQKISGHRQRASIKTQLYHLQRVLLGIIRKRKAKWQHVPTWSQNTILH